MQLNILKVFLLKYVDIALIYYSSSKMLPEGHHSTKKQEDKTELLFHLGKSINVCKVFS